MTLLKVRNLSVGFKHHLGYTYKVVKGIDFELNKGEVLGIVGESGSGKSLTALSILGLLPYPKAFHGKESSIKFSDTELIANKDINDFRGGRIGFVFQEPMSSLNPLHKIGEQITETLVLHQKMQHKEAKEEAVRLLELTGVADARVKFNAYPHELSGGQRQRVVIAMAIANKPDILIADEPTTALDVTVAAQILDLLIKLKNDLGMAIIFISHDLNVIKRIADRVLVMKSGKIIEQGNVEDIFSSPHERYTKTLICSSNILKKYKYSNKQFVLETKGVTVKYPISKTFFGKVKEYLIAANKISIKLKKGKTLGVVGESGSGKTTLAFAIAGLNEFEGIVELEGIKLSEYKARELRKKIQIVFQDPYNSLNPRMTIEDIIGEGIRVHFPRLSPQEYKNKIRRVIKEVGLKDNVLDKYPHEFSGGQRQRIAIARALVVEPEILILDEPTSALDVTIAAQILRLLRKIQNTKEITYLFISHDMRAVRALADDVAVMREGRIVELNSALNVFENPKNPYTKKLIYSANMRRRYGR